MAQGVAGSTLSQEPPTPRPASTTATFDSEPADMRLEPVTGFEPLLALG